MAIAAPSEARRRAMPSPMPCAPPVIMTTVFSSLAIVFVLLVRQSGASLQRPPQPPSADPGKSAFEGKAATTPLSILAAIVISASFTGARRPRSKSFIVAGRTYGRGHVDLLAEAMNLRKRRAALSPTAAITRRAL